MNRRYLILLIASLAGAVIVALPILQYNNASGLPFQVERTRAGQLTVVAMRGLALPDGLQEGDVIDWRAMTPKTRMAINSLISFQRLAIGSSYTLVIQRGQNRLNVPVTSVSLTGATGRFSALMFMVIQNILLLMLSLFTLWRGRNWGAWGLSLYAFMWMLGGSNGILSDSLTEGFVFLIASDFVIYPLSLIGLYVSAESLAGSFLGSRLRLSFRTMLTVLIILLEIMSVPRSFGAIFLGWQVAQWYGLMMTCAISLILLALLVLANGYRHAPPESRLRLRWIMAATVILVADMLLQYLTPLALSPTGGLIINLLLAICFACYLYGVLRYRLIDFAIVIDRTLVYGATTTVVIGILSGMEAIAQHAALGEHTSMALQVGVPLALGITLGALHKRFDAWVERLFFWRRHKAGQALRDFAESCAFIEHETALLDRAIHLLKQHTRAPGVALYERNQAGYAAIRQLPHAHYPHDINVDDPVAVLLRAGRSEVNLLDAGSTLGKDGYAFPMTVRGNLLGVVVVAHRPSEHYSKEERALLEHVVHEIGIALFAARARGQAQFLTESANDNTLPESWRLRARKLILGIREA